MNEYIRDFANFWLLIFQTDSHFGIVLPYFSIKSIWALI
jgi:hypothetical protein